MAKKEDVFGYHLKPIPKGELGELSKIQEEMLEALDAQKQKCEIMVLVELSDMLGAIEMYLKKHHPSLTLDDLKTMSAITARAFESGHRVNRPLAKDKGKNLAKDQPKSKGKTKPLSTSQHLPSLSTKDGKQEEDKQ